MKKANKLNLVTKMKTHGATIPMFRHGIQTHHLCTLHIIVLIWQLRLYIACVKNVLSWIWGVTCFGLSH